MKRCFSIMLLPLLMTLCLPPLALSRPLKAALGTPGLELMDIFPKTRRNVVQAINGAQVPWESSSIMYEYYFEMAVSDPTT